MCSFWPNRWKNAVLVPAMMTYMNNLLLIVSWYLRARSLVWSQYYEVLCSVSIIHFSMECPSSAVLSNEIGHKLDHIYPLISVLPESLPHQFRAGMLLNRTLVGKWWARLLQTNQHHSSGTISPTGPAYCGASRPHKGRADWLSKTMWQSKVFWGLWMRTGLLPWYTARTRSPPQLSSSLLYKGLASPGDSRAWACWQPCSTQADHMQFSKFYLYSEWERKPSERWEFLLKFQGLVDINRLNFDLCSADDLP